MDEEKKEFPKDDVRHWIKPLPETEKKIATRKELEVAARQEMGYDQNETLGSTEQMCVDQAVDRAIQEDSAARGIRPSEMKVGEHGTVMASRMTGGNMATPRVSDFYLIKTSMEPEEFLAFVNDDVLGQYEVKTEPCGADFGMIVMRHQPPVEIKDRSLVSGPGQSHGTAMVTTKEPMILAKFDAGPWEWYDRASTAIVARIVQRLNCRAWVCGWALDKEWSWVEHWRPHRTTGEATLTETVDGPANGEVTRKAMERWGINVRAAFDDLHLGAQHEALRRWLILPEPRPIPYVAHVSHLAGKLLIQAGDEKWIPEKWAKNYPDRKPGDGPLHLQAYYLPIEGSGAFIPHAKEKALSFRTEPPSSAPESGESL